MSVNNTMLIHHVTMLWKKSFTGTGLNAFITAVPIAPPHPPKRNPHHQNNPNITAINPAPNKLTKPNFTLEPVLTCRTEGEGFGLELPVEFELGAPAPVLDTTNSEE